MSEKLELKIGAKTLSIETGEMAKLADGAVTVQYGETIALVTAVISDTPKDLGFFPLSVDYREKTYAAGKIPGGFFKREGRPSEKEILTARLIDRPIRPLFVKDLYNEVQVMVLVLSSDGENDPDVLSVVGASTALMLANIPFGEDCPFKGPVGAVRVAKVEGEFVINPTYAQLETSTLQLVLIGTEEGTVMIEAGASEVAEEDVVEAIKFAQKDINAIIDLQRKLQKKIAAISKRNKRVLELKPVDPELIKKVEELASGQITKIFETNEKERRLEQTDSLTKGLLEKLVDEEAGCTEKNVSNALNIVMKAQMRKLILKNKVRINGRKYTEIRNIDCKAGLLPRTHGSALFTRGETQSLSIVTLGSSSDEQRVETLEGQIFKNFMLHYNFPPFSVGEVRPARGPGRREIGHGVLAEKGLRAVMPSKEDFPYTVRISSEILESNGSSSMATVCAGTLSLMDAGVPIKAPVSGIAMGLIKEGADVAILTDILGLEDHFGDADFKVIGTRDGITAIQVDLKIRGISVELIAQILTQAKEARLNILDTMDKEIKEPRTALSQYAPKIHVIKVDTSRIGEIIGPGGKTIRKIIQDTGADINIEDDGSVYISTPDQTALNAAIATIEGLMEEPEIGKIYKGTIKKVAAFGAFCEYLPKKEGLIHVSELADKFVKNVEDHVNVGDEVTVKLIEIDKQGRVKLSIKQATPSETKDDNA